jgi:hypothetical protein
MRRPSNTVANRGTARRAAPGRAVFENPMMYAAITPAISASAVNTDGMVGAAATVSVVAWLTGPNSA